jgi:hypothetical protein
VARNIPAKTCAERVISIIGTTTGLSMVAGPQVLNIILAAVAASSLLLILVLAAALFGSRRLSSRAFLLIRLGATDAGRRAQFPKVPQAQRSSKDEETPRGTLSADSD